MEPGEKVLSEVHLYHTCEALPTKISNSVTRFEIKLPLINSNRTPSKVLNDEHEVDDTTTGPEEDRTEAESCPSHLEVDEDGDLILCRCRKSEDKAVITLEHRLATELKDVGEQVWAGALLLCDYILHHRDNFSGKAVLDLGAGTGLTTIVAAMTAETVYCTDVGEGVLSMAQYNVELNSDLTSSCNVKVRELDWCQDCLVPGKGSFGLSESDIMDILHVDVIIAADVIYDDDATEALLRMLHLLMSQGPAKTLYMGLEKRLVFTLADLDIACPAYTHFFQGLIKLQQHGCEGRQLLYSQVDEELPMYLDYSRTKELEIWKIQSVLPNG